MPKLPRLIEYVTGEGEAMRKSDEGYWILNLRRGCEVLNIES